jgi:hypothetical protein
MILWLERKNNIDHDLVTRKKWYWSWFSQRLERNNDIDHDLVTIMINIIISFWPLNHDQYSYFSPVTKSWSILLFLSGH